MENLDDWLRLWHIPGIGPKSFNYLLNKYPNISDLFKSSYAQLASANIPNKIIKAVLENKSSHYKNDINWLNSESCHHIIVISQPEYPELLRQIHAPPPILYARGNLDLLNIFPCIAIIGGRKASTHGQSLAFEFSSQLASSNVTVVSGLARGIDKQAHQGALSTEKGQTIAVLANGLDTIYPLEHRLIAEEISTQGLLLSEFPPGVKPLPQHFPRRNRIISGLSLGVVVFEAAEKSGSLITAKYALEQNREVFSVPGPINNPLNKGCHQLIQDGAKLTTSVEDIFSELNCLNNHTTEHSDCSQVNHALPNDFNKLLDYLDYAPLPIELIIEKSGLTPEQVSYMLTELEIGGHVVSDAYGHYFRA